MTTRALNEAMLARWRQSPVRFIEEVLIDPETGRPWQLLPAEIAFLEHAFKLGPDGRLLYPELVYACPKKSGKTTFAAIILLTVLLLYGGKFAESFVLANDLEQSIGRIFTVCARIVEASPLLKREARITAVRIVFLSLGATIQAIPNNFAGAAGAIAPVITAIDEPWAITSERSRRTVDEMVPTPSRPISCRLFTTYAGFAGESTLLEELHRRGLKQPLVGKDLYGGDGILMFWSHEPVAPWQNDAWLAEMRRSLRPAQYQRMVENRFVTSETTFLDPAAWERIEDPNLRPVIADRSLPVYCAVDASIKHDSTAICAVTFDRQAQQVRLVAHRIFQPSPERPIDFEGAIESTMLDWSRAFRIKACLYDPYQMVAVSQRLSRYGLKMQEFPQTIPNLTEAASNLYELVHGRNLSVYRDEQIRTAVARTVAIETPRGWRIGKDRQSYKIDVVISMAMAALAAVRDQKRGRSRLFFGQADGWGRLTEHDIKTGRPLAEGRSRLYRGADGQLHLLSDNTCWRSDERRGHNTRGFY